MGVYNFIMFILYTMVYNNETVSSTGNSAEESPKTDAEVEWKNLPVLPPGFYFVPSPCVLILEFLVKKIKGADLASDMVKVRDGVQLLDPEQHRFSEFLFIYLFYLLFITINHGFRFTVIYSLCVLPLRSGFMVWYHEIRARGKLLNLIHWHFWGLGFISTSLPFGVVCAFTWNFNPTR